MVFPVNASFMEQDGKAYCEADYVALFAATVSTFHVIHIHRFSVPSAVMQLRGKLCLRLGNHFMSNVSLVRNARARLVI